MFFYRRNKLKNAVVAADNAKKVNPLDLSADQDLTIAVMNLIKLEELLDGACTSDGYNMCSAISDIRHMLMGRVVSDKNSEVWDVSFSLLGVAMDFMERGLRECDTSAYAFFDRAYEIYSLFWGLNMGMVTISDVKQEMEL